jgi:hypothetical protein
MSSKKAVEDRRGAIIWPAASPQSFAAANGWVVSKPFDVGILFPANAPPALAGVERIDCFMKVWGAFGREAVCAIVHTNRSIPDCPNVIPAPFSWYGCSQAFIAAPWTWRSTLEETTGGSVDSFSGEARRPS